MEGFINLYRSLIGWEWFGCSEMVHVFIYLLLSASYEDRNWRGQIVKRGQVVTSRNDIMAVTRITEKKVRNCIERLQKSNEIVVKTSNKFSIITICNYDKYQQNQTLEVQQKSSESPAKVQLQLIEKVKKEEISSLSKDNSDTKNTEPSLKSKKTKKDSGTRIITMQDVIKDAEEMLFSTFDENLKRQLNEYLEFCKEATDEFPDITTNLKQQMSFKEYRSLRSRDGDEKMDKKQIKSIMSKLENTIGLEKKNKSIYKTILAWIDNQKIWNKNKSKSSNN